MRSRRLTSVIDPVNSGATSGASEASSGLTSMVTIGELAEPAVSRVMRPWPRSPPAPVMRTTGLRIGDGGRERAALQTCTRPPDGCDVLPTCVTPDEPARSFLRFLQGDRFTVARGFGRV